MDRIRVALWLSVWVLPNFTLKVGAEMSPVTITHNERTIVIQNGIISLMYDSHHRVFSASRGDRTFIILGDLSNDLVSAERPEIHVAPCSDHLGAGQMIEIDYPSGRSEHLALYEGSPFIIASVSIGNLTEEPIVVSEIHPLQALVNVGRPVASLRFQGCESATPLDGQRTSYAFCAIAEPESRAAVVCGFLTHNRGSGIIAAEPQSEAVLIRTWDEYGKLQVPPGETVEGESLAIGYFADGLDGLEAFADACARANQVHLPPVLSGYCTWYHDRASNEKDIADLARFSAEELKEYGFQFIQIDDFWQISTEMEKRDFTAHKKDGPYPSGMKLTADTIKSKGFKAGLWLIPFAWSPDAPVLKDHHDWFVKQPSGDIYKVFWAGYCLDCTRPETRAFLKEVIGRITHEWGYNYLKLDGLWSGMATKILYPTADYRPDEIGEAVFSDPTQSPLDAYRTGLRTVREAAGTDVFLLGCNIAQNMRTLGASYGLLDAMRIGRDVDAKWDHILPCVEMGSYLYFYHGKVWYNDPDCLLLREPLTLDQARAWASFISLSGQLNVVSEALPNLPAERLDIFKRTIPNHGGLGRPIDLFESKIPKIWHLQIGSGNLRRDVVGVFNWDSENATTVHVELDRLGLATGLSDAYTGFEFWENHFVPSIAPAFDVELPPTSCRVFAIRPVVQHPDVVSTSRHLTQGGVDLSALEWNAVHKELRGVSRVVKNDPYELRIVIPKGAAVSKAIEAAPADEIHKTDAKITSRQDGPQLRVRIESPVTGDIAWSVRFE